MSLTQLITWTSAFAFLCSVVVGCTFDPLKDEGRLGSTTSGGASAKKTADQPKGEPVEQNIAVIPQPADELPPDINGPKMDTKKPLLPQEGKVANVGKNVFLQILPGGKRRVLVNAYICMRRGQLEVFLCRTRTKEHEAVLAANVDARIIHATLEAAKAEAGSPVSFLPKYKPAHGTTIKVLVQYKDKKGKVVTVPAQKWIRNIKTNKEMSIDWVFAGSKLVRIDPTQPPMYAANDGTVICVSNFDVAMLDLPIELSNADNALLYEAWTDRIPALHTPVQVILEPVLMQQKKAK